MSSHNTDASREKGAEIWDDTRAAVDASDGVKYTKYRRELVEALLQRGAERGLIERVVIDTAESRGKTEPVPLQRVANITGLEDEYADHLSGADEEFLAHALRIAARTTGIHLNRT